MKVIISVARKESQTEGLDHPSTNHLYALNLRYLLPYSLLNLMEVLSCLMVLSLCLFELKSVFLFVCNLYTDDLLHLVLLEYQSLVGFSREF